MTSVLHETHGGRHREEEEMRRRDGEIETSHTEPLRTGRGSKAGSPLRHFRGLRACWLHCGFVPGIHFHPCQPSFVVFLRLAPGNKCAKSQLSAWHSGSTCSPKTQSRAPTVCCFGLYTSLFPAASCRQINERAIRVWASAIQFTCGPAS